MNRARTLLADAGLVAVAAVEALYDAPVEPLTVGVTALAVGVLVFRRRRPVAVFVVTLPGLAIVGSVLATLVALYHLLDAARPDGRR